MLAGPVLIMSILDMASQLTEPRILYGEFGLYAGHRSNMKTRIIPIVLVMLAVTIADSMETVDKLRPPRSDMLITYETRKDSKGETKHEMVVTHPTGLVVFINESDLQEQRAILLAEKLRVETELAIVDDQIKEVQKLAVKP